MKDKLILIAAALILTACATPSTLFMTPEGKIVQCSAHGWGYVGAPMANQIHGHCVSEMRTLGNLPLDEAGMIGVAPSSDASSVKILKVQNGSPADLAGMRAGDVILSIDNQEVTNWTDARILLFGHAGTALKVQYRSSGQEKTTNIIRAAASTLQKTTQ